MRKLIAIWAFGFATLGVGAQKASAWPLLDHLFGRQRCCANSSCRQYNAFSPFCCDGAGGYGPLPGYPYGASQASSFPSGQAYLGELPAPGAIGGQVLNAPAAPPVNGVPTLSSPQGTSSDSTRAGQPGVPARPWPAWGPGMMNPAGVPSYYPGLTGYPPANGTGVPSYYPGFTGYPPANGFGR